MPRMHWHRMKKSKAERKHSLIRRTIQLGFTCFLNGYATGFLKGKIFTGKTKAFCVPVLNCYSCPGALGACPIGAMQTVLGKQHGKIPFYVLGILMLFGVVCGRFLCGFVCPFGFIQDLLYKLPGRKVRVPQKADKPLRWVKYLVLAVFVVLLPAFAQDAHGIVIPWFCKYICPAGTLEGGIPLLLSDARLRALAGGLFNWKVGLLIAILAASVLIHRFFCRYLCPLGAFYALFNKFSLYQMHVSQPKCIGCGKCEKVCPMAVEVRKNINSPECIRCGKCKAACPSKAIEVHFASLPKDETYDIASKLPGIDNRTSGSEGKEEK